MQIQISNITDLGKSVQGQDYTVYGKQKWFPIWLACIY